MKTIIFLATLILTSRLTFAGDPSASVTLNNFNGNISDHQQVELSWKTMMESNIIRYEIQRSGDGMYFQVVDSIDSKMEINTNDYQLVYTYTDTKPLPGTSFYRIRVVGKDGYSNLSVVIQINNNINEGTKIYPTLVQNNTVFVESDKTLRSVKMEFFDLSGYKISETDLTSLSGRQNIQVSKSGKLHNGPYVARLSSNGETIKNQMVMIQSN